MIYRNYKKEEIATRMLETAIDLFFSGGDGFSIIHLAAASEEIVAGLLEGEAANSGRCISTARDGAISVLKEIHVVHGTERTEKQIGTYLNAVRNQTKHHSPESDPIEIAVCLDLEVECALSRAIQNHVHLFGMANEKIIYYANQHGR